ncbi:LysM peptidoglycan-binding domain-containing protein [Spirillospora sp. CA-294931]|uniref:LysM peptidoglycan-binding domain-containing protein n=1 Tax=Spirillospora sp. CA-294931 TaxID=3240042 RepID=UPI003D8E219E
MIKQLFEEVLAFCRCRAVELRTGVRSNIHSKIDGRRPVARRAEMSDSPPRGEAPEPGLRLTRRGRAVLTGLIATILLILFWLTAGSGASAGGENAEREKPGQKGRFATTIVEPRETLWEIAERNDPKADPRITVQRIRDLNGLGSTSIVQPGQHLRLPAK